MPPKKQTPLYEAVSADSKQGLVDENPALQSVNGGIEAGFAKPILEKEAEKINFIDWWLGSKGLGTNTITVNTYFNPLTRPELEIGVASHAGSWWEYPRFILNYYAQFITPEGKILVIPNSAFILEAEIEFKPKMVVREALRNLLRITANRANTSLVPIVCGAFTEQGINIPNNTSPDTYGWYGRYYEEVDRPKHHGLSVPIERIIPNAGEGNCFLTPMWQYFCIY